MLNSIQELVIKNFSVFICGLDCLVGSVSESSIIRKKFFVQAELVYINYHAGDICMLLLSYDHTLIPKVWDEFFFYPSKYEIG